MNRKQMDFGVISAHIADKGICQTASSVPAFSGLTGGASQCWLILSPSEAIFGAQVEAK